MRKILQDVVETINKLVTKGCLVIDVARVRECLDIPTSDRSSIGFNAKALDILTRHDLLEVGPRRTPKQYKVTKSFTWADVEGLNREQAKKQRNEEVISLPAMGAFR